MKDFVCWIETRQEFKELGHRLLQKKPTKFLVYPSTVMGSSESIELLIVFCQGQSLFGHFSETEWSNIWFVLMSGNGLLWLSQRHGDRGTWTRTRITGLVGFRHRDVKVIVLLAYGQLLWEMRECVHIWRTYQKYWD